MKNLSGLSRKIATERAEEKSRDRVGPALASSEGLKWGLKSGSSKELPSSNVRPYQYTNVYQTKPFSSALGKSDSLQPKKAPSGTTTASGLRDFGTALSQQQQGNGYRADLMSKNLISERTEAKYMSSSGYSHSIHSGAQVADLTAQNEKLQQLLDELSSLKEAPDHYTYTKLKHTVFLSQAPREDTTVIDPEETKANELKEQRLTQELGFLTKYQEELHETLATLEKIRHKSRESTHATLDALGNTVREIHRRSSEN